MSLIKRILNVGCGDDTYGTHFVDKYPSGKNVKKCELDNEKLPLKDNYFDEVLSQNVLEHLTNVGFAIKEMHRVLKAGGILKLTTDNASYMPFHVKNGAHMGWYDKSHNYEDKHFSLFTLSHIRNLFLNFNFKILKLEYTDENYEYFLFKKTFASVVFYYLKRLLPQNFRYPRIRIVAMK